eukprot:2220833-Alexandrium_andersonii.AAC.1
MVRGSHGELGQRPERGRFVGCGREGGVRSEGGWTEVGRSAGMGAEQRGVGERGNMRGCRTA